MKIKIRYTLFTALLLAIAMIFSAFGVSAEEVTDEAEAKTPLSSSEYAFFNALGMTEKNIAFYEEDNITRGDFAYVIARLAGYKGGSYKASKTFADISNDAYYRDAVNYLYDMKIVNGSGYRMFEPQSDISFNEMAKISVTLLGYGEIASAKYGASPLCYVRMADNLDLFDGIDMSEGSTFATTEQAFTFLKNTAVATTAQVDVYGEETTEFVFDSKNTLLYINYGIAWDEGVVYDNGLTSTEGPSKHKAGSAVIGDVVLRKTAGDFDITGFIGMYVEFFYYEDSDALVYASLVENNNVIRIAYDSLVPDDKSFSHTNVVYYNENDKLKEAKISMNASMIYNGVAYPGYSLAQLKIKSGYLTLIDSGTDKVYDIVSAVEYDDRYLTSLDINANILYTETGTIRLDDYKNMVVTDHNGMIKGLDKLTKRSIISVLASKDNTFIRIIDCSALSVNGIVTGLDDDYIYVDDTPYITSDAFYRNQNAEMPDSQNPVVGRRYTFLLNADGDIVKARPETADGWFTGYCVGIANEGSGINADIKARIFMLDKTLFEPYLKERIKLNGGNGTVKAEDILSSDLFFNNGKPIRQPIKFKLNSWGEIVEIETAIDNVDRTEYGFNTDYFSKDMYYPSVSFKGDSVKAINSMYFVSNQTLIIYDPYLTEENPGYQIKDIQVLSSNEMSSYSGFDEAYLYDIDAGLNVGIFVFGDFGSGSKGDEYWDTVLLTVDKVSRVLDEEEQIRKCVTGVSYGTSVKYFEEKEGILPAGLKQGDVCRIKTVNGEIKDIEVLISLAGDHQEAFISGKLINTTWSNAYGPIYSVSDNSVVLVGPDESEYGKLLGFSNNNTNTRITIYDRELEKVYAGSWKDVYTNVAPNSIGEAVIDDSTPRAYIYRRYDYAREMVIVK